MSRIRIDGLTKWFGHGSDRTYAANELGLTIEHGEFVVLLGPSGCGKTTTLRCLSGLETPQQGRIDFGDQSVFDSQRGIDVPTHHRSIGMVFQSYALWPHKTVRKNIEYPLRARRLKDGLREGWADEAARLAGCDHLMERHPGQLSGGQQQRVALARGLAPRPDLLLFDEPLSNLDAKLRDRVRSQIHELHTRLEFTAVFVTHDQAEALALADRIVILNTGVVEQVDTPRRLYDAPATEYVASFIGMSNRLALVRGDRWQVEDGPDVDVTLGEVPASSRVVLRARPEDIEVVPPGTSRPGGALDVPARVVDVTFGGRELDVVVQLADSDQRLFARVPLKEGDGERHIQVESDVTARVLLRHARWYAADHAARETPDPAVATS